MEPQTIQPTLQPAEQTVAPMPSQVKTPNTLHEPMPVQTNEQKNIPRHQLGSTIKIQSSLLRGARDYFTRMGFHEVPVPTITKATGSCENVDTMFEMTHFGSRAYLAQTGQLYLESLLPVVDKVFCVGPSSRAEHKIDDRHLTQFTLMEIEFTGNLPQLMNHIEQTILSMVREVLNTSRAELQELGVNTTHLDTLQAPFTKISYEQAVKIVNEKLDNTVVFGSDLTSKHEKFLVEYFGNKPLFVTHYPEAIKFFNMRTNAKDSRLVNSTDLLLPFSGESVGAAEREFEPDYVIDKLEKSIMLKQLKERGGSIDDFKWYVDNMREHGSVPHAGCGFGFERIMQFVMASNDIRVTPFFMNKGSLR